MLNRHQYKLEKESGENESQISRSSKDKNRSQVNFKFILNFYLINHFLVFPSLFNGS